MKRLVLLLTLTLLPIASSKAVDIELVCADKKSYELRISNVIDGCLENEYSLGEGPIPIPAKYPKKLNKTLQYRFSAAQAAAKKEGVYLKITSGFRTLERQTFLFNRALKRHGSYEAAVRWVLPPDVSHHPLGLAIDVNYPDEPEVARWLEVNGYKFGLCRVFKNEWWHFEGTIAPGWKCPKMYKSARALLKP